MNITESHLKVFYNNTRSVVERAIRVYKFTLGVHSLYYILVYILFFSVLYLHLYCLPCVFCVICNYYCFTTVFFSLSPFLLMQVYRMHFTVHCTMYNYACDKCVPHCAGMWGSAQCNGPPRRSRPLTKQCAAQYRSHSNPAAVNSQNLIIVNGDNINFFFSSELF